MVILSASRYTLGQVVGNQLTVVCEVLRQTACPASIRVSKDLGKSWANISDLRLGAPMWHGVAVDKYTGRIYGATGGNGIHYTDGKPDGNSRHSTGSR
jgi:hypothetical protein